MTVGRGSAGALADRAIGTVFAAATVSFAASLCLGIATAASVSRPGRKPASVVDGKPATDAGAGWAGGDRPVRSRWAHHALYVTSSVLCSAAASSLFWGGQRARRGGAAMVPAVGILLALPRFRGGTAGHALTAASATPFVALAASRVWE